MTSQRGNYDIEVPSYYWLPQQAHWKDVPMNMLRLATIQANFQRKPKK